jgi:phosphatidylserine decarboxylase
MLQPLVENTFVSPFALMSPPNHHLVHHRVGGWLPRDQRVLEAWIEKKIEQASRSKPEDFHPVIKEFQCLIEEDPEIWMAFHQMFEQVPKKPPYIDDPTKKLQVCDAPN